MKADDSIFSHATKYGKYNWFAAVDNIMNQFSLEEASFINNFIQLSILLRLGITTLQATVKT